MSSWTRHAAGATGLQTKCPAPHWPKGARRRRPPGWDSGMTWNTSDIAVIAVLWQLVAGEPGGAGGVGELPARVGIAVVVPGSERGQVRAADGGDEIPRIARVAQGHQPVAAAFRPPHRPDVPPGAH